MKQTLSELQFKLIHITEMVTNYSAHPLFIQNFWDFWNNLPEKTTSRVNNSTFRQQMKKSKSYESNISQQLYE